MEVRVGAQALVTPISSATAQASKHRVAICMVHQSNSYSYTQTYEANATFTFTVGILIHLLSN